MARGCCSALLVLLVAGSLCFMHFFMRAAGHDGGANGAPGENDGSQGICMFLRRPWTTASHCIEQGSSCKVEEPLRSVSDVESSEAKAEKVCKKRQCAFSSGPVSLVAARALRSEASAPPVQPCRSVREPAREPSVRASLSRDRRGHVPQEPTARFARDPIVERMLARARPIMDFKDEESEVWHQRRRALHDGRVATEARGSSENSSARGR